MHFVEELLAKMCLRVGRRDVNDITPMGIIVLFATCHISTTGKL